MSLSTSEVARLKFELGWNVLTTGAEPYIGITNLFDQIVVPNLPAGAATTSSTAVVAASAPTLVSLTLADPASFAAGERVWVGVDDNLETATVQSISGSVIAVSLMKAHSGTYPVSVDGGEAMVRELLDRIKATKAQLGSVFGTGALKKVDEIEFYNASGKTQFGLLGDQLMWWRDELASLLNVPNAWRWKRGGGATVSVC